jgi:hypothetical protein
VVVRDQVGYGMARMWSLMSRRSGVEIQPFTEATDAAVWLGLPNGYSIEDQLCAAAPGATR